MPKAEKSLRILRPLEQRPALATSCQLVFGFLYLGAHPKEPEHNRSSSPCATLADITERKAPKRGSQAIPTVTRDMIRS